MRLLVFLMFFFSLSFYNSDIHCNHLKSNIIPFKTGGKLTAYIRVKKNKCQVFDPHLSLFLTLYYNRHNDITSSHRGPVLFIPGKDLEELGHQLEQMFLKARVNTLIKSRL